MSPPADILGTSTVREAVSLHPEALVTLTSTTVSVVYTRSGLVHLRQPVPDLQVHH